jgi:hypothetical protein
MLAFDAMAKTLTLQSTTPGYGLHQFVTTNAKKDMIYATALTEPPRLYAWSIRDDWSLQYKDWVDIGAITFDFTCGTSKAILTVWLCSFDCLLLV